MDDDGIFATRARFLDEEESFLPQPTYAEFNLLSFLIIFTMFFRIKVMCRLDLTAVEIESIGQRLQLALTKLGEE